MTRSHEPTRLLRLALRANAAFSASSGAALLLGAESLAPWLGVPEPQILFSLGLNLLVFAALLLLLAAREQIRRGLALCVIALDLAWVAGSAVVLLSGILTTAGAWAVAGVAELVGAFAILQYLRVRRLPQLSRASAGAA